MLIKAIKHLNELPECEMIIFQLNGPACWFFNHFREFKTTEAVREFLEPFGDERVVSDNDLPCYVFETPKEPCSQLAMIISFLKFLGASFKHEEKAFADVPDYVYAVYKVSFPK